MSELDVRKDFICTTTENTNHGSRRIADTNYSSNLSKVCFKAECKNTASNLTIYMESLN
jgi:hypothetical protein